MSKAPVTIARLAAGLLIATAGPMTAAAQPAGQNLILAQIARAESAVSSDASDELKISALEALMAAPSERAFPLVKKVLEGGHSDAVKSRALFVLSQIPGPEAESLLLGMATDRNSPLQGDAIRMVGIGGSKDALRALGPVYRAGNAELRGKILQAYLIAGDAELVYEVARDASDDEEFDAAVQTLGAMQATVELRKLYEKGGESEGIIRAYAIAEDLESLLRIARESGNAEQRALAIRSIGIIDGATAGDALMDFYRNNTDEMTREAALRGLLINGHDQGILTLFRESSDSEEKRRLLAALVHMDSDLALELIDATLAGDTP